jgi:hypothetical protein
MTLTQNFEYQGPDAPGDTVVPPNLNPHINIRRLNAMCDVASKICAGICTYLSGTTNASDMTQAAATQGRDSQGGKLYVTEIEHSSIYFPATTTKPRYPNKMPNATCTLTDYTAAENTSIIQIPLEKGMVFWGLGSTNGSFDATKDYDYYLTTDGFWAAPGDPDGVAIDESGHCARALATTSNQNWVLLEYKGQVAHDKTA